MTPEDIDRFFMLLLAGQTPAAIIEEEFAGESRLFVERHVAWLSDSWQRFQTMCDEGQLAPLERYRNLVHAKRH